MADTIKKADEPVKVAVVSPLPQAQPSADEKKGNEQNFERMTENANAYAPAKPQRLDEGNWGNPPAQGPNVTKEVAEFSAAAFANPNAKNPEPEQWAAPTQAGDEPLAEPGKAPKKDDK